MKETLNSLRNSAALKEQMLARLQAQGKVFKSKYTDIFLSAKKGKALLSAFDKEYQGELAKHEGAQGKKPT
jgi:hypothetical protein